MSVLRDVGVVVMVVVHPSSPSFFPLQTYPPSSLSNTLSSPSFAFMQLHSFSSLPSFKSKHTYIDT
jgi:hypothetical protein